MLSLVIIFLSRTQVIKDFLSSNDADKAENHLILRPQIGPTYYVFYACHQKPALFVGCIVGNGSRGADRYAGDGSMCYEIL